MGAAARAVADLPDGSYVTFGIGLSTLAPNNVGDKDPDLINVRKEP